MKQQRALITKLKLDTVFGLGLEFKRKEKELIEFQQRIYELEQKRRRVTISSGCVVVSVLTVMRVVLVVV